MVNETMQDTRVGSLLLEEFRVSNLSATVKRELFQILGLVLKRSPLQSQNIAPTVQKLLFSELFSEVEKQKKPQIPIVVGSLKGITHLMHCLEPPPETGTTLRLSGLERVLRTRSTRSASANRQFPS